MPPYSLQHCLVLDDLSSADGDTSHTVLITFSFAFPQRMVLDEPEDANDYDDGRRATFELSNEDHTLGNSIRWMLMKE